MLSQILYVFTPSLICKYLYGVFSCWALFAVYPNHNMKWPPFLWTTGLRQVGSIRTQELANVAASKLMHLHMHRGSRFVSITERCRSSPTVVPLLPKANLTESIHHYLFLPRKRLTYAINTLLAKRCFAILLISTNYLKMLILLANSFYSSSRRRVNDLSFFDCNNIP